ncbi:MAG: SOS response-associated peptidase [Pirellulaceae bacterium]
MAFRHDEAAEFLPSEMVPVVRVKPHTHQRELVRLHWGLIPPSSCDPSGGRHFVHARSETVATKPIFREAFRRRRCLLVVDSFDISKERSGKRSHVIQTQDRRPFGVGAVWERWEQAGTEPLESCAVITTSANELVRPINDRMPVIIAEQDYSRWLDPEYFEIDELARMMRPFPADELEITAAS